MEKLTQGIPNIPEMIVVGIESTERDNDFTTENDRFWKFVSEELKPLVERKYRCKDFRIVVGHSLGGLSVVDALIKHTDLFNAYIAHDPSLWWGEGYGIKLFEQSKGKDFQNRLLYITHTGYKIRHNGRSGHVATFDKLKAMLTANAFPNLQWKISEYSKENHGTIQLIGNIDMFRVLFAEMFIDRNDIEENPQIITERYKALSQRLHYTFTPSESYLKHTMKWLQRNGKQTQAQEVEALLINFKEKNK
jgi:putative esterase